MNSTRKQVANIIHRCRTVIAEGKGKDLPPVDAALSTIAELILDRVKSENPNDKVLESVKLDKHMTWTTLLAAMEMIHAALPQSSE